MSERKGRWIFKVTDCGADECVCSLCGKNARTLKDTRLNFCPYCGADMQETESEIEHFLHMEIKQTIRGRLYPAGFYDGVYVGSRKATKLADNHIMFCEHLLKLIEKEKENEEK